GSFMLNFSKKLIVSLTVLSLLSDPIARLQSLRASYLSITQLDCTGFKYQALMLPIAYSPKLTEHISVSRSIASQIARAWENSPSLRLLFRPLLSKLVLGFMPLDGTGLIPSGNGHNMPAFLKQIEEKRKETSRMMPADIKARSMELKRLRQSGTPLQDI